MRDAIHTELLPNGNTLNIYQDEYSTDPRQDYDHLGTMICFHKRYNLGDKHNHSSINDALLSIIDDMADIELLKKLVKDRLIQFSHLRVKYLVERNGSPSTNDNKRNYWYDMLVDCLEWIPLTSNDLPLNITALPLYLYDHGGITIKTSPFSCIFDSGLVGFIYAIDGTEGLNHNDLVRCLMAEVSEYNSYLTGEVYCYTVTDSNGEHVDSCGGFIGDYRDIISEAIASNQALKQA